MRYVLSGFLNSWQVENEIIKSENYIYIYIYLLQKDNRFNENN